VGFDVDGHTEPDELVVHLLETPAAVDALLRQKPDQGRMLGIESVSEHVHVFRGLDRRDLDA